MNRMAPIGMTDCVNISGTRGRLTRWSPLSTCSTSMPVTASTPKNRNTKPSAIDGEQHAPAWRQRIDQAGHADMRAAQRRQRRAVIGQPHQPDLGDLVVPVERVAAIAESGAGDHQRGQRHHQRDDDPLHQALERRAESLEQGHCGKPSVPSGGVRDGGRAGGRRAAAARSPGSLRAGAERHGLVDQLLAALHFLGELVIDRLAGLDEGGGVGLVHLHALFLELGQQLGVEVGADLQRHRLHFDRRVLQDLLHLRRSA